MHSKTDHLRQAARLILEALDPNPNRSGIQDTPDRFAKSLDFLTSGYDQNPEEVLKCFEDGAEDYDEMLVQKGIPFFSLCEHHLLPFFGTVDIGYLPNGSILGLSKFSRLVEVFARRFQVQERMTTQIAEALFSSLRPKGVGVVVRARHLCMECRGVQKIGTETTTSALLEKFRDPAVRSEFFSLIGAPK